MSLRPVEIFYFFPCGGRLYTSESAVYKRQILMYKDGARAERVKGKKKARITILHLFQLVLNKICLYKKWPKATANRLSVPNVVFNAGPTSTDHW